uniref:Pentatricopeptide repeat-containing protein n=1 Tax=Noccaea caerulescens TaxID=107243 RepID=A0A1J3I837_NOCCA
MATLKPPESQLLKTLTSILTSERTHFLETLNPYIPHITQPLLCSLLSSPSLAKRPETLVSFFRWAQTSIPEAFASDSPLPLLSVVRSLLSHHKFADAKSLLVSYIRTSDASLSLCNSLLHPNLHLSPPPSKALFDISLGAYLQAGKPHVALQIFQKMIRLKLKPNHLTCNTLLIGLVRYPSSFSLSNAREVFDDMVKHGVSLNAKTFNVLIHGYCLEGKLDDAVAMIERMVSEFKVNPDNVTYNTILKAMSKKGRLNDVKELLLDMKKHGLVPNKDTYNNLVYGYCKLGSLKEAFQIVELMKQTNNLPDLCTYNMLMNGLCNAGSIREALELIEEMKELKLLPDVVSYNTLIDGCFELGLSSEAMKLMDQMENHGVKPNQVTHNISLKWLCKEEKMEEVTRKVKELVEVHGFAPDIVTYHTLINGYLKAGDLSGALEMMREMGKKGIKMNTVTLNTIADALCKERKVDEARSLLDSAVKRGYIVDEVSYGTLITGYFREEKVEKALEIWDEMKKRKIIPTVSTFNSVIGGLCHNGKTELAMERFDELAESGLLPDDTTFNSIILGYCKEGRVEKAFEFYNESIKHSFKPDNYTCNILLNGLCKEGMTEKALNFFNTLIEERDVDTVTYNTMISAFCKERKLKEAFDLLSEMEERGLEPDRFTYNSIITTLMEDGKLSEAEELMEKVSGKFGPLKVDLKAETEKNATTGTESKEEANSEAIAYSDVIKELCNRGRLKEQSRSYTG